MTTTAKRLVPGSVMTAASVAYYTAPLSTRAVIKSASIVNTTAGTISATVSIAGAAAANTLISARPVAAGETYTCPEMINHALGAGDTLQGLGNRLTLMVSRAEIV